MRTTPILDIGQPILALYLRSQERTHWPFQQHQLTITGVSHVLSCFDTFGLPTTLTTA